MAITGLNLPRAGEKYSAAKPSASFDGLAERMTEFRKKKKKEEDDAAAATKAAASKKQADDKAAADKAAQDKKNSLPSKVASGIADIFQADSAADKSRRVASGQPALYADQQAQKKQTADAFKGKTADEFGRADDGLNLSPDELNKRREHYKSAGIDVDQLQKDKAEYDSLQQRLKNGEKLYKLTLDNQITEGAKRYEKSKKSVAKAESSYQRNQQAAAGAETAGGQAERGFVRGMGSPLIEVPSNVETLLGSALKAVAPDGSRIQNAGEKVYERGKTDRQSLQSDIQHAGYAPTAADNPTISAFSEGAGSLAASLTAAKYLKATTAPAAMFGVNQGADQAVASQQAGKSDVQSAVTGVAAGAIEGLLEKVGLDKFLGAKGSVVKQVSTRMLTEGTQEATQSLAQSGATMTYSHVDLQQAIQQALTEGGLGALIGGGAGLPMSIAEHLQAKGVDQNTALQTGFNVQDRLESIIKEEKAAASGSSTKTGSGKPTDGVPGLIESDDPPPHPGLTVPANPENPNVKAALSAENDQPGKPKMVTPAQFIVSYKDKGQTVKTTFTDQPAALAEGERLRSSGFDPSIEIKQAVYGNVTKAETAPQSPESGAVPAQSTADSTSDMIKLRYPKVEDLPDAIKQQLAGKDRGHNGFSYDTEQRLKAGKVSQGDLERAGLQPLLSKADVKTLVSAVPQLQQNPILKVGVDEHHNTILTYSDENHDIKLRPGAFGLTHARLAAAGVSIGTEIDLSEALKPEKGSGPVATVQRNGKDYMVMPEDANKTQRDRQGRDYGSNVAKVENVVTEAARNGDDSGVRMTFQDGKQADLNYYIGDAGPPGRRHPTLVIGWIKAHQKGAGGQAMQELIDAAKREGVKDVTITQAVPEARDFWSHYGFDREHLDKYHGYQTIPVSDFKKAGSAGPQASQPSAPEATASSPATKNLFAGQTDTESQVATNTNTQVTNKLDSTKYEPVDDQYLPLMRNANLSKVLVVKNKQTDKYQIAYKSLGPKQKQGVHSSSFDTFDEALQSAVNEHERNVHLDAQIEASSDYWDMTRDERRAYDKKRDDEQRFRETGITPEQAAANLANAGKSQRRAPAAGGTIASNEKASPASHSTPADQHGRSEPAGTPGAKGSSTANAEVRRGDRSHADDRAAGDSSLRPGTTIKDQTAEADQHSVARQVEDSFAKTSTDWRETDRPAAELMQIAEQLQKAGQANAILRRGQLKSKKAAGMWVGKRQELLLKDKIIKDPKVYATVLAHELSHAIEFYVNGNNKSTLKIFGDITPEERLYITNELKAVVEEIEGKAVVASDPTYYNRPTEMLARYVELMVLQPGMVDKLAPITTEKFQALVQHNEMVGHLMDAINLKIDKGFHNFTPSFVKDIRQIYRKHLGKLAGDVAYDAEVVRRAEVQRSEKLIGQLIKQKFKGVKDDGADLFHAAEAILVTENGEPQFGTHDFKFDVSEKEYFDKFRDWKKEGWTLDSKSPVAMNAKGEIEYEYTLSKERYSPEQAQEIFDKLSPAGQQLIKDFTAAKEEAKDEFNRELMKQLYHIDSKIEGWVHHYFDGKPLAGNKKASLRHKVAAAKKERKGAEGYVEDFQKAITKALLELDRNDINNGFITKQLARISKPIVKGEKPDRGWVEVVADEKGGLRLPGEGMQILIKGDDGPAVRIAQKRYQVPEDLAVHYRDIRDVPMEANKAAVALNRLAKYWTLNVLIHPGTASTNFISGGLQYGAKISNDFYLDLLTANFGMSRTRHNLIAPLQVLLPRGWTNAPDWLYGGYRSNMAGQYATGSDTAVDRGLDEYGDKMLKVFGLVETYWKKSIALSEGSNLAGASNRRITDRLQKEEKQMVAAISEVIDTYAFDYDNKPLWLSKFDRKGGKIVKPFMTYPYKLTKFYTGFAAAAFDRSLPWQVRTAKVLTLTTIVAAIAMLYDDRDEKKTTPKGTDKTPLQLNPGGRVFVKTANDGKELFVRTAKYPWFNLTSLGKAAVDRNGAEVMQLLNEQIGTIGPGAELFLLATGRKDQFNQYTPTSEIIGEMIGSFIPGFRIFSDVGDAMDQKARKPKTFIQGIGSQLPVWGSEEQRAKLRGGVRTVKIPDETAEGRSIAKSSRTVTTRDVVNYKSDVLLSLLTGVYLRRIDPAEAKAQQLREIRDDAEEKVRQLLAEGNEADAAIEAEEHGLDIPPSVLTYYRAKRKNQ